jgi:hypothetical protein
MAFFQGKRTFGCGNLKQDEWIHTASPVFSRAVALGCPLLLDLE